MSACRIPTNQDQITAAERELLRRERFEETCWTMLRYATPVSRRGMQRQALAAMAARMNAEARLHDVVREAVNALPAQVERHLRSHGHADLLDGELLTACLSADEIADELGDIDGYARADER